ncbi:Ig-like domain repeat protein [Vibrio parahaemolyticus]|nr:Ig-like domain repeat protein [Vibrio parahaemolyticus]
MKQTNIVDFINENKPVSSFQVSGFNIIAKTKEGESLNIKNGVTDMLINNLSLPGENGSVINFENVISTIPGDSGVGFDSVYLEDLIKAENISNTEKSESESQTLNVEVESRYSQIIKMLTKLEKELEQKQKLLAESSNSEEQINKRNEELEKKAELIEDELRKIEAAKEVIEAKSAAESQRQKIAENQANNVVSTPTSSESDEKPNSSNSSESNSLPKEQESVLIPSLFISGGLSKDSDSGKVGDGYTSIARPTFSGKTLPNSSVTLTIDGKSYSFTADNKGDWSFQLPSILEDSNYKYTITATSKGNETKTLEGEITIEANAPKLESINWYNDSSDAKDLVNQTNPTLTGKTSPGATVTLEIDGKTYKTVANTEGTWTIVVTTPLVEGSFDYIVTSESKAGMSSKFESNLVVDISIDTTYFLIDAASDSGNKGDFVTNVNSPNLTGVTEPNSYIVITIDGKEFKTQADGNGSWNQIIPNLSDGIYNVNIEITDKAGNKLTQSGSITIDTTSPETSVTLSREDGSVVDNEFINTKTPTLSGKTEPNSIVVITINGQSYTTTSNEKGDWSYQVTTPFNEGNNSYSVVVTDQAGNVSSTITNNVVVMTNKPETPQASLSDKSDTGVTGDNITNQKNPTLTGTAQAGTTIVVTLGDKIYNTLVDSNGKWELNVGPLNDGQHDYTVVVVDKAGNTSDVVSGNSVTVDTSVPELTGGVNPNNTTVTTGNDQPIYTGNTPSFSGTGTPGNSIVVTINGKEYSTNVDADGTWTLTVEPALKDSNYVYTVTTTSKAGNSQTLTGGFTVDTVLETSGIGLSSDSDSGLSNSDNITNNVRPTLTGVTEPGSVVLITINKTEYQATLDSNGRWTFTLPSVLQDGSYKYTVSITDPAGNTSETEHDFIVDTKAEITAALDQISLLPGQGNDTTSDLRPTFSGTAEPGSVVHFIFQNTSYKVHVNEDGNWDFRLPQNVTEGSNTYEVTITDVAGNTKNYTGSFQYIADPSKGPQGILNIAESDDSGTKGDMITNVERPQFTGFATPGATVTLKLNGIDHTITIGADGNFTFNLPEGTTLHEGTNQYEFVVEKNGITSISRGELVLDSIISAINESNFVLDTNTGEKNDFSTKTRINSFSGKTEPGSTISMQINGKTYHGTVDKHGNYKIDIPDSLNDGNYPFVVTVTDKAGNTSTFEDSLRVDNNAHGYWIDVLDPFTSIDRVNYWGSTNPGFRINSTDNDPESIVKITYGPHTIYGKPNETIRFPEGMIDPSIFNKHTMFITVIDGAGNENRQQYSNVVIYKQSLTISGGIVAESDTDAKGDNATTDTRPNLEGSFTVHHQIPSSLYSGTITINGNTYPITLTNSGSGVIKWSFNYPDSAPELPSGDHNYKITITDKIGNTSESHHTVTINTLSAWLSESTDTGEFGDFITSNKNPILEGKASVGASVRVFFNGQYYEVTPDAQGKWTFDFASKLPESVLEDGKYDYKVIESVNGVTTTISQTITIDATPPTTTVIVTGPEGGTNAQLIGTDRPLFSGSTSAGAIIELSINGKTYKSTADANGNWSVTVDSLTDGQFNYTVNITSTTGMPGNPVQGNVHIAAELSWSFLAPDGTQVNNANTDVYTNDGTYSGLGKPGATVTFSLQGRTVSTTVNQDGKWSLNVLDILPIQPPVHGHAYSWSKLIITDPESGASKEVVFRFFLDKEAPDVNSFTTSLSSDSATGLDGYTNKTKPTLTGNTGAPFATITLTLNNVEYTVKANSNGQWTFTPPNDLTDGSYSFDYKVTDAAGNVSGTATGSFTVNTQAPALSYNLDPAHDSNIAGDNITNIKNQTLTGKINLDLKETVVVTVNGVVHHPTIDEQGNWTLNLSELSDGSYTINVTVTSISGVTTSGTTDLVIDTSIEAPTVDLDISTDSGLIGDKITNNQRPSFSGKAEPGASITFKITIDNVEHSYTTTADPWGKWTIALDKDLADNSYNYTVVAVDKAGNTSSEVSSSVTIVSTPTASNVVTAEVNGTTDGIVTSKTPTLTGEAKDSSGNALSNTMLQILLGDKKYLVSTNAQGKWTLNIDSQLTQGDHSYTVKLLDSNGNVTASTNGSFKVDSIVDFTLEGFQKSPTDVVTPNFTNTYTPTFVGTGEPNSTITITIAGQVLTGTIDAEGKWSITVNTALTNDNNDYTINIVDPHGNSKVVNGTMAIDKGLTEELIGGLSNESQLGGHDNVSNTKVPTFTGTTEPGATVSITIGENTYQTIADGKGDWSLTITDELPDGLYDYTISVTDKGGNTTDTPIKDTLLVAVDKPSAESSLSTGSNTGNSSDNITSNNQPTLVGNTRPGSIVTITFVEGTKTIVKETIAQPDGNWSLKLDQPLTEGEHSYTVSVTDKFGNTNSKTDSIVIDTAAPDAATVTVTDTNTENPTIGGTAEVGSTVVVTINDKEYPTTIDESGKWIVDWTDANKLTEGTYNYNIVVKDPAGNTSDPATGTFVVDTTAPNQAAVTITNDNTENPTIGGTAEVGSTVIVTINNQVYQTTTDDSGNWSINWNGDKPNSGEHNYSVVVKDSAGNQSQETTGTIRIQPEPVLPPQPDTGEDVNKPITFNGKAVAGTNVLLMINDEYYQSVADETDQWSIVISGSESLSEDVYQYSLLLSDNEGNESLTRHVFNRNEDMNNEEINQDTSDRNTLSFEGLTVANAVVSLQINQETYLAKANEVGEWQLTTNIHDNNNSLAYTLTSELNGDIIAQTSGVTGDRGNNETSILDDQQSFEGVVFEGRIPDDSTEIIFEFNSTKIDVTYSEDMTTWTASVRSDLVDVYNTYQASSIDTNGNISNVSSSEYIKQPNNNEYASNEQNSHNVDLFEQYTQQDDDLAEAY